MNKAEMKEIKRRVMEEELGEGWVDRSFEVGDILHDPDRNIVTLEQASAFVAWQSMRLDGQWDHANMADAFECLKTVLVL